MAKLEIACFTTESALVAANCGVDRIELCDGFAEGGTSPSFESTQRIREAFSSDLYVMIRPRGGNFVYTDEEFLRMKNEITGFKKLKVDGFVFGILNPDNSINKAQNSELVNLAKPFPCTFHRAFDQVSDAFQLLDEIIDCGFQTVLTSGQHKNVTEGAERLAELVSYADGRIVIMPGGGLRSSNIETIQQMTKADWFHSSAITDEKQIANPIEIRDLQNNLK